MSDAPETPPSRIARLRRIQYECACRLERIETRLESVETRLDRLETDRGTLTAQLSSSEGEPDALLREIAALFHASEERLMTAIAERLWAGRP